MRQPRDLVDLPYATHLETFTGQLSREGDMDTVRIAERDFEGTEVGGSRFTESVLSRVGFIDSGFRRVRFDDVWMHTVRWTACNLAETNWLDVEVNAGMLAGVEAWGAGMRRVAFLNCKFDSVNLRGAKLRDVDFVDCVLRDVDFGGATLDSVTFTGSTLEEAGFDKAQLKKVDLRGARALGIASGLEGLKGAVISNVQLLELAPALAHALGITVKDR
jgi:Uncharacterized low-complexity proteins